MTFNLVWKLLGKSTILLNLIKHRKKVFNTTFERIIYSYPKNDNSQLRVNYCNKLKEECDFIEFHSGLPDFSSLLSDCSVFLVLDDLCNILFNDSDVQELIFVNR